MPEAQNGVNVKGNVTTNIFDDKFNGAGHDSTNCIGRSWIWWIHDAEHRPEPNKLLVQESAMLVQ